MTDLAPSLLAAAPLSGLEGRRALAFRAATRHSRRVRVLRRATFGGALLFVAGVLVVSVFNPFGRTIEGVSVADVGVDGTKVTMANPKLSGHQKDGRPYAIEASRAVQDIKAPTLFDLFDLKARLVMADKSITNLTAATGRYNSAAETMVLAGGAHAVGDNGLDLVAQDATVEFKTNLLFTDKPVTVAMPGRRIAADAMRISEGGEQITFQGHVHTDFTPGEQTASLAAASGAPSP